MHKQRKAVESGGTARSVAVGRPAAAAPAAFPPCRRHPPAAHPFEVVLCICQSHFLDSDRCREQGAGTVGLWVSRDPSTGRLAGCSTPSTPCTQCSMCPALPQSTHSCPLSRHPHPPSSSSSAISLASHAWVGGPSGRVKHEAPGRVTWQAGSAQGPARPAGRIATQQARPPETAPSACAASHLAVPHALLLQELDERRRSRGVVCTQIGPPDAAQLVQDNLRRQGQGGGRRVGARRARAGLQSACLAAGGKRQRPSLVLAAASTCLGGAKSEEDHERLRCLALRGNASKALRRHAHALRSMDAAGASWWGRRPAVPPLPLPAHRCRPARRCCH